MADYNKILEQWQSFDIKTENDLDYYLDNFRILFAFNSNHIENPNTTYHDTREVFENGTVSSYTGDLRTLFEIQNQKDCYEFLKEKIVKREPLTQDLILKIHETLMHGCYDKAKYEKGERPGTYKKHLFVVGDDIGAEPEEIADELQFVLDEVIENEGENPLTVAAYLHLSFESIHPFADGNGRVGRTLMNYYLITHNYPPVIIFSEDKDTYYMALAVFDKTDKIDGFIKFIKEQAVKTWGRKEKKRVSLSDARPYYLEVTGQEAAYLTEQGIRYDGSISEEKINVIKISKSEKDKVKNMLEIFRRKNNYKK